MKTILVAGGAGYIGSHTTIELIENGYDVVIADNLYNSKEEAVRRVEKIVGRSVKFYKADVCDKDAMPVEYYENNIGGMLALIDVMREFNCKNLVFSSSATVYGNPHAVPITEDFPLSTTNPYGSTKLFIEYILKDVAKADPDFNIAILRYFNPIGAHPSGLIGEDPNGIPNNLCPYITKVAVGKLKEVHVFGNDYPTRDGTGVRDYIHVVDLAKGHVLAVDKLFKKPGLFIVNLGTGKGYSVLEMIKAFSKALGRDIPYVIDPRRPGDIPECYADPSLAYKLIGFKAEKTLDDMSKDALNWQTKNPDGYPD